MLFTGAALDATDRVRIADGGVVDHAVAGFVYTATNQLVTDSANAPESFIKGIGIRNTGAVCTTTITDPADVWIEGVRVSNAVGTEGRLVIEDAVPETYTSGNPIRLTGALATTVL